MPSQRFDDMKKSADKVAQARRSIERAIRPLVTLLGDDEMATVNEALFALRELGGRAIVTPLAEGLATASSERHRCFILGVLNEYGRGTDVRAIRALMAAREAEQNPLLCGMIQMAMLKLMTPRPPAREDDVASPSGEG